MLNKYKMVTCDLDGTLLGSDLRVSKENNMAISKFSKIGVPFVPCTGRTLAEMKEVVQNPDIRYIIYSNGAGILDKKTDEYIKNGFPREVKVDLLKILSAYDFFPFVHADGKSYIDGNLKERQKEFNLNDAVTYIANNLALSFEKFEKEVLEKEVEMLGLFFKDEEQFKRCREELMHDGRFIVTASFSMNIEVFYINAGKDNGIKILAEKLGIDIKDVINIGDSDNDAKALKACGLGICVSNGGEEVKKIADEIGCSNDEHIAEYVLKKYF